MATDSPTPLWREVVGETEPWRRGRLFLIIAAILSFTTQIATLTLDILAGYVEQALAVAISAALFWLQYYFIWIGVHWVRWLNGALTMLWGFALIIWGVRDGSGLAIVVGTYCLVMGAYLGLAPSVYFFAQQQREKVNWLEAAVVAAVFVLLLASFGAAAHAASLYKTRIEGEARQFADVAFRRIFTEHDTYFLLSHLTKHAEEQAGGRGRVTRFLQDATMHAGDVHDITRATGNAHLSYRFPDKLASEARMGALAVGAPGPLSLHLICGEAGGDWQIDQIWWVSETESPSPAR